MPVMEELMVNDAPPVQAEVSESSPPEADNRPPRLCSPQECRQAKKDKLNRILLPLLEKLPGKNGKAAIPWVSPSIVYSRGAVY